MGVTDTALATLREPLPSEASRWYKPRKSPASARLKVLADFLLEDETVRLVKRTEAATELVVDTGEGTSLRVTLRPDSIEVRLGPVLLQADKKPLSHDDYIDMVSSFVEVLQVGSGFYVYSDEMIGFDAKGSCPGCSMEVFEWQDECEICGAKLHVLRPGEDEHDAHAQRVVEVLLRRHMLELVNARSRRNVEKTVSLYYAYNGENPDILHGLLMEMPDVAELYCDAHELSRVIERIK
jgi:hypothetical protein